ncbi:MAG: hypothetical protein OTJ97_11315, partial [SAR202 cluster bacterium]|nr:hypothetical protein [SAR202 cluster bacterium]
IKAVRQDPVRHPPRAEAEPQAEEEIEPFRIHGTVVRNRLWGLSVQVPDLRLQLSQAVRECF